MNLRLLAVAALTSALLAACASQPKPLHGEFSPITPREATDRDSTGAVVRWGGRIVQVEPKEDRTCFEMISTRLNAYGRPYWAEDDTAGRSHPGNRHIRCTVSIVITSPYHDAT